MRTFLFIILIFVAVIIQFVLAEATDIAGIEIDFIIMFLILLTSKMGPVSLIFWAAAAGFMLDSFQPFTLGAFIASKATSAMIITNVFPSLNSKKSVNIGILAACVSLIERIIYFVFNSQGVPITYVLWRYILPGSIYTGMVCFIIHFIWQKRKMLTLRSSISMEQDI
ncbi:hypothetical protein JXI42_00820 [bacterium]|nr:hypothetical protein [bacterium]